MIKKEIVLIIFILLITSCKTSIDNSGNVKNGADAKIEEKNPDDYDEKLYLEFGVFVPTSGIMR